MDVSGVSGTGVVAHGCVFPDGTVALRWATEHRSTTVYDDIETVRKIHGHGGNTDVRWTGLYGLGMDNCIQDGFENCPFASVGGLEKRHAMVVPPYARPDGEEYLEGYRAMALASYGDDWETCSFGWAPALTVNEAKS